MYSKFIIGCFIFLITAHQSKAAVDIFDQGVLHEIRITTYKSNWYELLLHYYEAGQNGEKKKFIKTDISIDGEHIESVGFRMRGNYSNTGFEGKKKPFRLDFDKYVDNRLFQGLEKLNLNNFAGDPSFTREITAYNLMRHTGIKASRCSYTRLYIDNKYWGCYLILEEPDEHFVRRNFNYDTFSLIENKGNTTLAYKGNAFENYPEFDVQYSNASDSWIPFHDFITSIHNPSGIDYGLALQKSFKLSDYFKILATDAFISNYDSYATNRRNFFLLNNDHSSQVNWIPYDYNMSFWNIHYTPFPCLRGSDYMVPLVWKIRDNEHLRTDYLLSFCELISNDYSTFPIDELINSSYELIRNAVLEDTLKFYTDDDFVNSQTNAVAVKFKFSNHDAFVTLPSVKHHFKLRLNQMKYLINQEGINCERSQEKELDVRIYPNPSTGIIRVVSLGVVSEEERLTIDLYSQQGAHLNSFDLGTVEMTEISLETFASGHYLLKLTKGKITKTIPIIKL